MVFIDPALSPPYHPNVQPVISAEQMREIDLLTTREYHVPSLSLMQAAAEACFREIAAHFSGNLAGKKVQVLCGPGNNGGDGAALAAELSHAGLRVDVVLFGSVENTKGDAQTNFEIVRRLASHQTGTSAVDGPAATLSFVECDTVAAWENLPQPRQTYDVIVDALFGTGLSRPLEGIFVHVVQDLAWIRRARESLSRCGPLIVSIDLPSGLNADLAKPIGEAVQADLTITFTAPKIANVLPPAARLNGRLVVANIGSPTSLIEAAKPNLFVTEENDVRQWLIATRYTPGSFKNTHGHALVIAGSRGFTGAAVLCGNAAMRSGAGLVTIATPASAQASIAASVMPEVMTTALAETDRGAVSDEAIDHAMQLASKANVIAIGPGLSAEDERTRRFVYAIVKQRQTSVVIDADGLNCLAPWPTDLEGSDHAPIVLTPHAGEMRRLLETTDKAALDDRVAVARDFASKHKLILVLKGARSLVAAPDGRVFINPTGNAGLGTAGAGDTLTGIIAGFMAQADATLKAQADALTATIAALYVGGLAGDFAARELGMRAMVASDIREHLSEAIRFLDPKGEQP
ncbi:MAG TPA: NAD(P)H-hydrate dehydratase [Pyrinomonadaceae bacterium]|nr:NAD(P)H-hydrate dehydratase [Pyrinomonadaceae bacterium]